MGDKNLSILIKADDQATRQFAKVATGAESTAARVNRVGGAKSKFFSSLGDDLNRGQLSMTSFSGAAAAALGPVAAIGAATVGLGAGLTALALKTSAQGAMFDDLAQKTGVSVETLSLLQITAQRGEMAIDALGNVLNKMQRNMFDAAAGTGEAAVSFRQLGVSISGPNGLRDTVDVLMDLADQFAAMPDGATKTALAMKIFGKQGAEMIPILNQGSAAIEQQIEKARSLGIVWSTENAAASAILQDNIDDLKMAFTGLRNEIGQEFITDLTNITTSMTELTVSAREMTQSLAEQYPKLYAVATLLKTWVKMQGVGTWGRSTRKGVWADGTDVDADGNLNLGVINPPKKTPKPPAPPGGRSAAAARGYAESFNSADMLSSTSAWGTDSDEGWLGRNDGEIEKAAAFELAKSEAVLAEQQRFRDAYLAATESVFQGGTDIMADALADMIRGQKVGAKQMLKATGQMLGGVASQMGSFYVAEGVAKIAEAGWPPNPLALKAGWGEVYAGLGLKTLGSLLGGGGGAGGAGKGGKGAGGVGVGADAPNRDTAEPRAADSNVIIAGVDKLRGRFVMGDYADIVGAFLEEFNSAAQRDYHIEFAG